MASMANQRRRLRQLEDFRKDLLETMGNATQAANHRFNIGQATDEDLEILEKEVSPILLIEIDRVFRLDGRTREQQLAAAPVERLAYEAACLGHDRPALHKAMRALRHLGATGEFRTASGMKRATPAEQSYARLLLRHVIGLYEPKDSEANAAAGPEDTGTGDGAA
jgi:hypothetical protein